MCATSPFRERQACLGQDLVNCPQSVEVEAQCFAKSHEAERK